MRTQVQFRSAKFLPGDAAEEGPNPERGGRGLAQYLKEQLPRFDVGVEAILPEDWGWMVRLKHDRFPMWIGCGRLDENPDSHLVFIEPSRPRVRPFPFLRTIDTSADIERVATVIDSILTADAEIHDIRWESE